jgi:hypothetical protein
MASLVASALDRARGYAGAVAWDPLVKTSRHLILSLLSQIKTGRLTVVERDGKETICGQVGGEAVHPQVQLRVVRNAFWLRLALFADMVRNVAPFFPRA